MSKKKRRLKMQVLELRAQIERLDALVNRQTTAMKNGLSAIATARQMLEEETVPF